MCSPKQVPIRRMDAPRPAPANVEAGKKATQQRAAPKKRRQAVAGGSTVLAALFCLFIYCGVGIPRVGIPTRELKFPHLAQPKALQFGRDQVEGVTVGGRTLQAADFEGRREQYLLSSSKHVHCSNKLLCVVASPNLGRHIRTNLEVVCEALQTQTSLS